MKNAKILWIDLEMTGLSPQKDRILEVAAIATDWDFNEIATFESSVKVDEKVIEERMVGEFWETFSETRDALKAQNLQATKNSSEVEAELVEFIKENFHRKIVVVGASTGTDAHTVGIDAIMNRKGFAGHYGLERYEMIEAYNLGSQVANEEFIEKARELKADVLLVSQTVTQKDIHIKNLTNLVELLEADELRDKYVLICGGARITHELAKELGYDAGFGTGKFADDVATFAVTEMLRRGLGK